MNLTEDDIPGASLNGRQPCFLKNEELRFWLKCRGDSLKGLKTKAQLVKRVEEYIESGRDKNVIDPDSGQIYTKRKERKQANSSSHANSDLSVIPCYPKDGWSKDLQRMPFFTRGEMNSHIARTGKNLDPTNNHSVPTCIRKATTFLNDEYLKDIQAASDADKFYFKAQCHHSFRKNDPPHSINLALSIISGEVIHANCTCVAGKVGFCNHSLALMLKICKFSLYECKNVCDLDSEDDMNPKETCTSRLQKWHKKGRGDVIKPQPVMDVSVFKTSNETSTSTSREPGVRCQLYEARNSVQNQRQAEHQLQAKLQALKPKMALTQLLGSHLLSPPGPVETKFGPCDQGSYGSYQLAFTEDNFKVYTDLSSFERVPAQDINYEYPALPLSDSQDNFIIPPNLEEEEVDLLNSLKVDRAKLNEIERKTRGQSGSDDWKKERTFRFTASNFGLITNRKRQHESLVNNLLHPKPVNNRYTKHGNQYESIAIKQYQKFMYSVKKPVLVYKSGLVVSSTAPYLGASPDGKVLDKGCDPPFGLIEVKCPETKFMVTPLDACSHEGFFLENCNGQPKLKTNHSYYKQVQGQLGITGAKWCDFVVYTSKGMSIERIRFDEQFWLNLQDSLKNYYFTHFLSKAASEFNRAE